LTVTVSDYYVVGCPECCAEIERITRAAIRDFSVTKLTFTPGHRHNHEVEKPAALRAGDGAPSPSAVALEAAGQQTIPGTLDTSKPYVEGE
jgi:hypothetical protein